MQKFSSNGKLLLTGEYVVLDGATALAIPTKYGQSLKINPSTEDGILWESLDNDGTVWFSDKFKIENGIFFSENNLNEISIQLLKILQEAKDLNPEFLSESTAIKIKTKLDFPRNWGLGTSSTLINNIAQWAEVDAFKLLWKSFGGSGFDVAAAQHDSPIFFEKSGYDCSVQKIHLPWDFFTDRLFFIYLNEKQNSKEGIKKYRTHSVSKSKILKISDISRKLLLCYTLQDFENLMVAHERIISEILKIQPIQERLFSDFNGIVKSLGAWGGDFVLATGDVANMEYFKRKGFDTIIPFDEMMKQQTEN
ncbi:GYDIA family GHMP kinase [Aequorivita echinoideorum]|uniref:GHMP kinase n=1 Tax=Aequorivita echinoideorum TaxID=1549647 RepID=A0ABS5S2K2_9FLAO|nr:GYDIA family GHMP kinase [Aequorivita echinoideorum]MBT0607421.1 GHMP kinase [Aequorivita echinoideorum]